MANALKVLFQRESGNSKTLIVGVTLSGNYPGDPGEVLTLQAGAIPNPNAKTQTGPSYNSLTPSVPPKIGAQALGGYLAALVPTATIGQFDLRFYFGGSGNAAPQELAAGAYPAAISGGTLTLELEFDLGS